METTNAMEVKEAGNRGNNLLMSGFLAVLGFGLIPEILRETEFINQLDDIILVLLAIVVTGWYLYGTNRFQRSLVPFGLLIIALVTKIAALPIEINDVDAAGDEFGVIPLLILIVILSGYILYSSRESNTRETGPVPA